MKPNLGKLIRLSPYLICLAVLFWMTPDSYSPIDQGYIYTVSIIFLSAVLIHFLAGDKSNWLRLDVFFILGFIVVHFQWPIMYSFSNIIPEEYWEIFVDDRFINYTTWLSAVGGVCFLIGFHIFNFKKKEGHVPLTQHFEYKNLLIFTLVSFIIFLLYAGTVFLTGGIYKGEEGNLSGDGISKYFSLVYQIGLVVLTALLIYKNKDKYKGSLIIWFLGFNKIYLGIVFTYVLLYFLIGDRGGPLALILLILILVGGLVRKFRLLEVLAFIFIGGFLLTIIGLGRKEASGLEIFEAGIDEFEYASGYDSTVELANSFRCLNMAVSEVPSKKDFFYGSLWAAPLLGPIPFAQSAYLKLTNLEWFEIDSSGYITYLTLGRYPTWGLGTSLIADIYMNFGLIGIVIFMFLLGIFIRRLFIELKAPSSFDWLIVAATIAGVSLYYSRAGYFSSLRDVLWGILFVRLMVKPLRRKKN